MKMGMFLEAQIVQVQTVRKEDVTTIRREPKPRRASKTTAEGRRHQGPAPGRTVEGRAIVVNDRLYRLFHDTAPRGVRNWGFAMGQSSRVSCMDSVPYRTAVHQAISKARSMGVSSITVLP
jgi:hypothetical protein